MERVGEMDIKEGADAGVEAMALSRFRRICVFCGSSKGKKTSYQDAASVLGEELVARKIDLVYGGGSVGLMGLVSQTVYRGGRHVLGASMALEQLDPIMQLLVGSVALAAGVRSRRTYVWVIPKALMSREITGETIGEVRTVEDMHQRKAEMARQSDAFIALPAGYGTLEELFEVITWAQLGIHEKPVGLLNVDGYYNDLLYFIDKAVEEGFIEPTGRNIIVLAPTPKELLDKLEEYSPRHKEVIPKMKREMEQKVCCCKNHEIQGRPEDGEAKEGSEFVAD